MSVPLSWDEGPYRHSRGCSRALLKNCESSSPLQSQSRWVWAEHLASSWNTANSQAWGRKKRKRRMRRRKWRSGRDAGMTLAEAGGRRIRCFHNRIEDNLISHKGTMRLGHRPWRLGVQCWWRGGTGSLRRCSSWCRTPLEEKKIKRRF